MKILLFGTNGQVGWELARSLSFYGDLITHDRETADFTNSEQVVDLIKLVKPDIVVNAVAYTAVDQAETEYDIAYQINAVTVAKIAETCAQLDATLIHYSTDYVFDGLKDGFYLEDDQTVPQSVYGTTKLQGELNILDSGCKHFILRTSWVYSPRGNNFAKTIIKLAMEKEDLSVVSDQYGAPTSAELIADITARLVSKLQDDEDFSLHHSGTYHLVSSGITTWHGFAKFVLEQAKNMGKSLKVCADDVVAIPSSAFPRPAKRPLNSKLNTYKLSSLLKIKLPPWQQHVSRMVTEYLEER
jgi:dTDP-4-dehydrorhamnose reductase